MEHEKKIWGVRKNVFLLGLVSFFNDISSEMVLSVFPAFFTSVLKSGAASLGIVEGAADAMAGFLRVYSGARSDRDGKRKVLVIFGYLASVATRPLYAFARSFPFVAFLRVFDRAGKGIREAPRDALISLSSSEKEYGRSFGVHKAMDMMGGILGPIVAFLLLRAAPDNFKNVFAVAFVAGMIALGTLYFVKERTTLLAIGKIKPRTFLRLPPSMKRYLGSVFFLSFGTIPIALLLLQTETVGLSIAVIPLMYAFHNFVSAFSSITFGRIFDKFGARVVLVGGYLSLLIGYAAIAFAHDPVFLILGFFFIGLFTAATEGIGRSYIAYLVEADCRGRAYGFLHATNGVGALCSGFVFGVLWQVFGAGITLSIAGMMVIIGLLFLRSVFEHEEKMICATHA